MSTDASDGYEAHGCIDTELTLNELVQQMERIDWAHVPGISASTASTFSQKLLKAQERLQERS